METQTETQGVYVAMKTTLNSTKELLSFIKENKVPNPINDNDFHNTIIYSTSYDNVEVDENLEIETKIIEYKVFVDGDGKNILVGILDNPKFKDIHEKFMNEYNLTYDYDEYIPHITLSYDIGDFDYTKLEKFDGVLKFNNMYKEDLDLTWTSSE